MNYLNSFKSYLIFTDSRGSPEEWVGGYLGVRVGWDNAHAHAHLHVHAHMHMHMHMNDLRKVYKLGLKSCSFHKSKTELTHIF